MNEMTLQVDTSAVEAAKMEVVKRADALSVITESDYQGAADMLRTIKTVSKKVDETFDPAIGAAHEAHRVAIATKKKFSEPLNAAEKTVKSKMSSWSMEQEKVRAAEQDRLRQIAYREAEDKRLAEASKLEAAGRKEEAMQTLDAPIVAAPVVMAPAVPQTQGIAMKKVWKWEVENADLIPRAYLMTDDAKIGGVVRAMRGETSIPGIRVYEESNVSARGY